MHGKQFVGYCFPRRLDDVHVFLKFIEGIPEKVVELRSGHEEKMGLLVARRREIRRDVEMPRGDFERGLPLGILIIVVDNYRQCRCHLYCVVTDRLGQA